ncbi:dynein heavy chain and region D6 of dynein motor [Helicosporidium sp. ATCC 50920]|nr:dynein heavy chain and region D6 of dynein motor [Helicosporidium sp. ATCC 50920]|eukprot:KDD76898.1 dynein heavy chain and region D6 of dynein motor [Helicosporidium sp. ATCC 50920]
MDWALDKTALIVEVTRRTPEQITDTSREGAYFHGMFMEGARWDEKVGQLEECRPKELVCRMPVMLAKAVHVDKLDVRSCYECPVYATAKRFRQELFTVHLPTRQSWIKWTVAGVCLLVEEP